MAATSIHNALDRERIDRLLNCFTLIQKQKKQLDLIKVVARELKTIVQFQSCTILVVNPELMRVCETLKPDLDELSIARFTIDGSRACLGVSEQDTITSPVFTKTDEIKYGLKSLQYIA